jgi:Icc protein
VEFHSSSPPKPLEILQFTDLHLLSDLAETLWGLNTYETFANVRDEALSRYQSVDLILLTGDLVHVPDDASYRLVQKSLTSISIPIYRLPGNHDDSRLMDKFLSGNAIIPDRSILLGNWQIVLLDSNAPADKGGRLKNTELDHLDHCLRAFPDHHALICLHHHPVPIMSSWMDTMALQNPQDLFAVVDRHAQVRGVVWGHIHQEFSGHRDRVKLLGTPSTSLQFKPHCKEFDTDDLGPGFRWLCLHPNGRIKTRVHYLS